MKRTLILALLLAPSAARADFVLRLPWVYVEVGPAVVVRAPFVSVVVPRTQPAPVVPAVPVRPITPPVDDGPPPVPDADRLPAPKAVAVRAITPGDFVAGTKPFRAGEYEVTFLHPHSRKPVTVSFTLPVAPRRVNVTRDRIDFRWGLLKGITIEFLRDGGVRLS